MCPGTGGAGQDSEGSSTPCLGQVSLQGYRALLGTIGVGQSPMGLIQCWTQGMLLALVKRQHVVPRPALGMPIPGPHGHCQPHTSYP